MKTLKIHLLEGMGLVTPLKLMMGTPEIHITSKRNINSVKILNLSIFLTISDSISIEPALTSFL